MEHNEKGLVFFFPLKWYKFFSFNKNLQLSNISNIIMSNMS